MKVRCVDQNFIGKNCLHCERKNNLLKACKTATKAKKLIKWKIFEGLQGRNKKVNKMENRPLSPSYGNDQSLMYQTALRGRNSIYNRKIVPKRRLLVVPLLFLVQFLVNESFVANSAPGFMRKIRGANVTSQIGLTKSRISQEMRLFVVSCHLFHLTGRDGIVTDKAITLCATSPDVPFYMIQHLPPQKGNINIY